MGHASPEDMRRLPYMAGTAPLIPFANYVTRGKYSFLGEEYQLQVTKPRWAPDGIAMHGFLADKPWNLESKQVTGSDATVSYKYTIGENDFEGYPFQLTAKHEMRLGEGFSSEVTVRNEGMKPLPLAMGSHPYLRLGEEPEETIDGWELTIPSSRMLPKNDVNPSNFSVQEVSGTSFDFTKPRIIGKTNFSGILWLFETGEKTTARLSNPETGFTLDLTLNRGYRYMLFYTPSSPDYYKRRSLAIEPMCGTPDAFTNGIGLACLEPGRSFTAAYTIRGSYDKR
jgi:aldose 1-epimerase